jgi:glycosyltransferase involved in cell wall biosynthesis
VTLFASGDSVTCATLVPVAPRATWTMEPRPPDEAAMEEALEIVAGYVRRRAFDVVHAHLEGDSIALAERLPGAPVVATFHGAVDIGSLPDDLPRATSGHRGARIWAIAISRSQSLRSPGTHWTAVVLEAIPVGPAPTGDLAFVGRVDPEKGLLDAIEVARMTGRKLRVAIKIGADPEQHAYFESVVRPAFERADVEYLGEVDEDERNRLLAEAAATLMPLSWAEPFGLVAIESLAAGTPVLAYPAGAIPEIVRDGIDGALRHDPVELAAAVDAAVRLDRATIRADVIARFGPERMTDGYEKAYRKASRAGRAPGEARGCRHPPAVPDARLSRRRVSRIARRSRSRSRRRRSRRHRPAEGAPPCRHEWAASGRGHGVPPTAGGIADGGVRKSMSGPSGAPCPKRGPQQRDATGGLSVAGSGRTPTARPPRAPLGCAPDAGPAPGRTARSRPGCAARRGAPPR